MTEHSNNKEILPIIHLVSTDIFLDNMYGGYNGCEPIKLPPQMPRIFQIMDSSIWNYMVPLIDHTVTYENEKKKQEITLKDKFKNALGCIFDNYNKGLYYLSITNEYADLNARISGESFLYGSHAPGVSPFIFHSESAIDYLIEKEFNVDSEQENNNVYSKIKQIAQHNWRILLIDDKAKTPLRLNRRVQDNKDVQKYVKQTDNQFIGSNYDLPRNCKLRIIEDVLCEVFKNQPIHIAHRYLGKKKKIK